MWRIPQLGGGFYFGLAANLLAVLWTWPYWLMPDRSYWSGLGQDLSFAGLCAVLFLVGACWCVLDLCRGNRGGWWGLVLCVTPLPVYASVATLSLRLTGKVFYLGD